MMYDTTCGVVVQYEDPYNETRLTDLSIDPRSMLEDSGNETLKKQKGKRKRMQTIYNP